MLTCPSPSRRRRSGKDAAAQGGFTLIELLVVVVILGILSAVVVFSVRGVNDKGKGSAVKIDERTIRTAEETYCAQRGRYASQETLVAEGFLSDLPTYNQVYFSNRGGSCNGTSFSMLRTAEADPYPVGRWDSITAPELEQAEILVRLDDGRVLGIGYGLGYESWATQVWDPSTNVWSTVDAMPFTSPYLRSNNAILLTDDPATPESECKGAVDNCGKAFVWGKYLFDPKVAPGTTGQWETLPNPGNCNICDTPDASFGQVQMMRSVGQCGSKCGKIFLFATDGFNSPNWNAYDPRDNSYSLVPATTDPFVYQMALGGSFSTQLPDGRIFICCLGNMSAFFDPETLEFTSIGTPDAPPEAGPPGSTTFGQRLGGSIPIPTLPNGDLFFGASSSSVAGTYSPQADGPGTFKFGPGCMPAAEFGECRVVGSLPDGRVLAIQSNGFDNSQSRVWVYNPATRAWSATGGLNNNASFAYTGDAVLLDPAQGPCGEYCGKIMIAGQVSAEVYTP